MESKKRGQQALRATDDILISELDNRLELGTLILDPALSVLDVAACNTATCNVQCCPVEVCPNQP